MVGAANTTIGVRTDESRQTAADIGDCQLTMGLTTNIQYLPACFARMMQQRPRTSLLRRARLMRPL